MQPTHQQQSKTKLIASIVTIVVVAGIVLLVDHLKSKPATSTASTANSMTSQPTDTTSSTNSTTATDTSTATTSTSSSGAYKDGTYTASSTYSVPHGNESIKVTLTVKDDTVTDSTIVNSESDHDSAEYQEGFASSYKSYVVGKKIADIKVGTIAGASDTAQGFTDALTQIETQAQA